MSDKRFANYVLDLGTISWELALDSKARGGGPFDRGRLMAFHEVVSLMQSQAAAFGITREEIGLAGIEPEVDLL